MLKKFVGWKKDEMTINSLKLENGLSEAFISLTQFLNLTRLLPPLNFY